MNMCNQAFWRENQGTHGANSYSTTPISPEISNTSMQDTMIRLDMSEFMEKHTDPRQPRQQESKNKMWCGSNGSKNQMTKNMFWYLVFSFETPLIAGFSKMRDPPAEHRGLSRWCFCLTMKVTKPMVWHRLRLVVFKTWLEQHGKQYWINEWYSN